MALSEEGGRVTGGYFADSAPCAAGPLAGDAALAARLWAYSLECTGAPDVPARAAGGGFVGPPQCNGD